MIVFAIEQSFLTDDSGAPVRRPVTVYRKTLQAQSARGAVVAFIEADHARLLGSVSDYPGERATAVAWKNGALYTVAAERTSD
jgi:hypothetical protein